VNKSLFGYKIIWWVLLS